MRMSALVLASLSVFVASCSTPLLTYDTIDQTMTVDKIYRDEVLNNFAKTIDDPFAIPSISDIASGTVQSTIMVTPGITAPLSPTVTKSGSGITSALASAGSGFSLSGSDAVLQNWTVSPVTDANTLRNFRALYRFVLYGSSLKDEYLVPRQLKGDKLIDDPYYIQLPQCVECGMSGSVNPKLHTGWLYWTGGQSPNPPKGEGDVFLGNFRGHDLYESKEAFQKGFLSDFVFFMLGTPEPSPAGSSATSPSQKAGAVKGRSTGRNVPYELITPTGPVPVN